MKAEPGFLMIRPHFALLQNMKTTLVISEFGWNPIYGCGCQSSLTGIMSNMIMRNDVKLTAFLNGNEALVMNFKSLCEDVCESQDFPALFTFLCH